MLHQASTARQAPTFSLYKVGLAIMYQSILYSFSLHLFQYFYICVLVLARYSSYLRNTLKEYRFSSSNVEVFGGFRSKCSGASRGSRATRKSWTITKINVNRINELRIVKLKIIFTNKLGLWI
jgi:hypothetical protein